MTAPAPSPYEQAEIDRFGIFAEEETVERVAAAMYAADNGDIRPFDRVNGWDQERYRRLARAAIAAMPR